jgi:lysophospholipase L1-like esterase
MFYTLEGVNRKMHTKIEDLLVKIEIPIMLKKGIDKRNKYYGKKIVTFGDSITWYNRRKFRETHKESGEKVKGYQEYIKEEFGCVVDNQGVASWNMPQIINKITAYNFVKSDIVTITSGANDHRTGVKVGTLQPKNSNFDKTTFAGSLQFAIEHILNSNQNIIIVLITPIKGWFYEFNTTNVPNKDPKAVGVLSEEYPRIIREIGGLYDIPVLDWYNELEIDEVNQEIFLGDNPKVFTAYQLHPTNKGYKKIGEKLVEFMKLEFKNY